ncbi:MAG: hypothetical protein JXJ04_07355 [Spirochaetales bacterium]|nr:hypothetical protein [Spirochaetales bacterium]
MKKINIYNCFIFLSIIIVLTSCSTVVVRWPGESIEKGDRVLPLLQGTDIFKDFLWTTPPFSTQQVIFKDGQATIRFKNHDLNLELDDGSLYIEYNRAEDVAGNQITQQNYYYNKDILGTKTVMKQRYVSETYTDTEQVQVMKTRFVQKYVPVQKSRMEYDSVTGSWRTVYYTDYEWQTQSESYWDWETRSVTKTRWKWVTVPVSVIDIPEYSIYYFEIAENNRCVLYEIQEGDETNYYFQNVNYLYAVEKEKNYWGNEKEIKLIFLDANSNGIYFEPDDMVLFNTWNPYEQDSAYQEITSFMDNFWYKFKDLQYEAFLTFIANAEYDTLSIVNANSGYIGIKEKGTLTITHLEEDMILKINGKQYTGIKNGVFKSSIEYGVFNVQIIKYGFLAFENVFTIDGKNPEYSIEYKETDPAGTFIFTGHNFKNWKMVFKDNHDETFTFINENTVSVKPGHYTINISAEGNGFSKDIILSPGDIIEYNFSNDSITKK